MPRMTRALRAIGIRVVAVQPSPHQLQGAANLCAPTWPTTAVPVRHQPVGGALPPACGG
jgi:hypothetical protein